MIKLRLKAKDISYPKVEMICPMCKQTLTYWNISPYACVNCKGVLPNVDSIMRTITNRKEYYNTTKERW